MRITISSLTSLLGNEQNQAKSLDTEAIEILNQVLKSQGGQATQVQSSTAKKRSPIITIIIVLVIAVVVYFLLRACGIL